MADPGEKKRRATYQDVVDAPPDKVAEIVDGELLVTSRPAMPATSVCSALYDELGPPFKRGRGGPGGWVILFEPELHLGEHVIVPDLAAWRRERLPIMPDAAFCTVTPHWICEVLSKSTEKTDRASKMPIYAELGGGHAWLVDPTRRTLEAYRLHDGQWLAIGVYKDLEHASIEPFDTVELDLAALWADVPLPTRASEGQAVYGHDLEA